MLRVSKQVRWIRSEVMWRNSLPTEKRSSYLRESLSHALQWVPRHKYVSLIILFLASMTVISTLAVVQYAVARIGQQRGASIGTHSTSVSSDVQTTATAQQMQEPSKTDETTPENQASINSQTQTEATTNVKVNGQKIAVPENGTVHTTVPTNNGSTSVSINVDANSTDSSSSSSSSFVQVSSNSTQSQVNIEHSQ